MNRKGRWADWGAIVAGLALGASWVWHGMQGFSGGSLFILGLGVVVAAVFSLTRPGALSSEVATLALGVLTFLLPWLLGFTHLALAAWSVWILGAVIAVLGAYGLVKARKTRQEDPDSRWSVHTTENWDGDSPPRPAGNR
ncbi:SPW repeat protein [Nocardiopsis algeriensis]|uniref:Phosphoglycerol transferase MdoB-like AlkP superfamily enzyme n=1 Tax=Nocardiopsis algeriensis TaxID=1478215 RepID=A0A841IKZ6_9ACTN|nr:SPW repeat protein [Nocardiopsis algeriensis]MBB6118820.1 phosphoglycerol transferase MdoB-like AlkP superfamily enzyme [Nocardiopsis algeriensis]